MTMSSVNSGGVEFMRHRVFLSPVFEWNRSRIWFMLQEGQQCHHMQEAVSIGILVGNASLPCLTCLT